MLQFIQDNFVILLTKKHRRLERLKRQISASVQGNLKAKIIIFNLNKDHTSAAGKVSPSTFFPPFCAVLAQCGIASIYSNDNKNIVDEINDSKGIPIIVINLVHELHDDTNRYEFPVQVAQNVTAIFNSYQTAGIIGDKKKANEYLSNYGISMPSMTFDLRKKIFSNARFSSHEKVYLHDSIDEADVNRYNTEFIDTKVEYRRTKFFTTIRLMCIGSTIVQIYCRAADVENGNPSVHSADTPHDSGLMRHLCDKLVIPNVFQFQNIAKNIENALGPGFYAHDLLIDQISGDILVSETGFKFYDTVYSDHMRNVIGNCDLLTGVMNANSYATYAASVFITYCVANRFI